MLLSLLLKMVVGGGSFYAFLCLVIFKWQNRLVFFPSSKIDTTPDRFGLTYENVWLPIPNRDQDFLHGWWLTSPANSGGVVLFLHGNGYNVGRNLEQAKVFEQIGLNTFLFDYRGYGKSRGHFPTEAQVYEDAQVALNYLIEKRGIAPKDIFVFGHSLGGAIAIELATHNPDIAGLIIQSSFTSIIDMVDHDKIYKIFPINWILNHHFNSLSKLSQIERPILFIHGDRDERIPLRMSQILFEAANLPKALYVVPYGDHNHIPAFGGEPYLQKLCEWVHSIRLISANY